MVPIKKKIDEDRGIHRYTQTSTTTTTLLLFYHYRSTTSQMALDALCTPGIAASIAGKIDPLDCGLKGLFLLANDARYREELVPLMDPLKSKYERELYERRVREELAATIPALLADIEAGYEELRQWIELLNFGLLSYVRIKDYPAVQAHFPKHSERMKELYAYLSDHSDFLPSLGEGLARALCEGHVRYVLKIEGLYTEFHQDEIFANLWDCEEDFLDKMWYKLDDWIEIIHGITLEEFCGDYA